MLPLLLFACLPSLLSLSCPCLLPNFTPFSLVSLIFPILFSPSLSLDLSCCDLYPEKEVNDRMDGFLGHYTLSLVSRIQLSVLSVQLLYCPVYPDLLNFKKTIIMLHCSHTYILPPLQSVKMVQAMH